MSRTPSLAKLTGEFTFVLVVSATIGATIGAIQGAIAFSPLSRFSLLSGRNLAFAGISALVGASVSIVIGPLIYYIILRAHLTWRAFGVAILTCLLITVVATTMLTMLTLGAGGWLSAFLTPVIAVLVALKVRQKSNSLHSRVIDSV